VKISVVWMPEADAELQSAKKWYGSIRPELAQRFSLAVEATVEALARNPRRFPLVDNFRRRAGVRRFPYGIFFELQEHRVVVLACFHARRNPEEWQRRTT